jgi:hypothetical protein
MRFLLLALMIALLPVRGWTGNAMAVDMAAQAVAKAQKAGVAAASPEAAPGADASMPADCPMHAQVQVDDAASTDAPQAGGGHCNACDTCELCLALATSTWPDAAPTAFTRHAKPLAIGHGFSSADRFSSFKPPIS